MDVIVRLTDENVEVLRRYRRRAATRDDVANRHDIKEDLWGQVMDVVALYDQLVAEAQAASDE